MARKGVRRAIVESYHRLRDEKGALPTSVEIGEDCGVGINWVRKILKSEGLEFDKLNSNEEAVKGHIKKRVEMEEIFRKTHASMSEKLGRVPTRQEMNTAMGYKTESKRSGEVARRLGLELHDLRRRKPMGQAAEPAPVPKPEPERKTPAQIAQEKREANVQTFANRATPSMLRIMEIRNGDTYGEGKGWGHSPAEGYEITDRKMITCPVCGSRALIAPRMHPFWLRNRLGKVVFVDSRACTGQHVT